jgi:hypothetical protein
VAATSSVKVAHCVVSWKLRVKSTFKGPASTPSANVMAWSFSA